MTLASQNDLEARFDGPIPAHLTETPASQALAERHALAALERMLSEYIDEAERLEGRIDELTRDPASDPFAAHNLEVAKARTISTTRNIAWAMEAVAAKRKRLGMAPHPIMAAAAVKLAAE